MAKIKLAVAGCAGRMGKLLLEAITADDQFELSAGTVRVGSPFDQQDINTIIGGAITGITMTVDPNNLFKEADCVIDFSHPSVLDTHLQAALKARKPLVIGVTGLSDDDHQAIRQAALTIPILQAANTSLGINLLLKLVHQAAQCLGDDYDIDIVEAHHRHKKDAPSGTSFALARAAHQGHPTPLTDYFYTLPSLTTREKGTIGFSVSRGGGYPGDHSVVFASNGEVVELKHRAFNRQIYAQGAIKAALWLIHQPAGLYSMGDVLDLAKQ